MGSVIRGKTAPFRAPQMTDAIENGLRRVRLTWYGPFDKLNAAKPATGDVLAGYEGLVVRTSVCDRDETGVFGVLVVTLDADQSGVSTIAPINKLLRETREIVWMPNSRPLASHPNAATYAAELYAWMGESEAGLKKQFKYKTYTYDNEGKQTACEITEMDASAQVWAKKIAAGVESWTDYYPIARLTGVYSAEPVTEGCGRGFLGEPTGFHLPSGHDWMKTGDNATQNTDRSWNRTREWTGVKGMWDRDIYL